VPTYIRPDRLALSPHALGRLEYPDDHYKVIVVDEGSLVSLENVAVRFHQQLNVPLLRQPHAVPAAALNLSATHAKGEFWAFTDDACMSSTDGLQKLERLVVITWEAVIGSVGLRSANPW